MTPEQNKAIELAAEIMFPYEQGEPTYNAVQDGKREVFSHMKMKYTTEIERLSQQLSAYEADINEAAGELMVPIPEPGTDASKMLHANVMMRKYRIPELQQEIETLKAANAEMFSLEEIQYALEYNELTLVKVQQILIQLQAQKIAKKVKEGIKP